MNLPTLTGQIMARADDWAVEEKSGTEIFGQGERGRRKADEERREREEEREREGGRKMEACGLEEPQLAKDFLSGE